MMTTLTTPPLAPVLDRLFKEADAMSPAMIPAAAGLSEDERTRLMRSKTDYVEFYRQMKDLPLPVSRETGALLYMLARSCGARSIVEFGTSFGISTLHLAAALRDNGGGRLITTEFEPSKIERAKDNLSVCGLIDLVEFREGDALQTLSVDLPESIDMVLLDGAKALIPRYWISWSEVFGRALSSSRTMPTTAPTTWRACAHPRTAISLFHSRTMWNSQCGSTEAEEPAPTGFERERIRRRKALAAFRTMTVSRR
jgi:predicted O-methyltransferase YrrM